MHIQYTQQEKEFFKAVKEYRELIIGNFHSRRGEEDDLTGIKRKIKDLFKQCPMESKKSFHYIAFKAFDRNVINGNSEPLNDWMFRKCFELNYELESI